VIAGPIHRVSSKRLIEIRAGAFADRASDGGSGPWSRVGDYSFDWRGALSREMIILKLNQNQGVSRSDRSGTNQPRGQVSQNGVELTVQSTQYCSLVWNCRSDLGGFKRGMTAVRIGHTTQP